MTPGALLRGRVESPRADGSSFDVISVIRQPRDPKKNKPYMQNIPRRLAADHLNALRQIESGLPPLQVVNTGCIKKTGPTRYEMDMTKDSFPRTKFVIETAYQVQVMDEVFKNGSAMCSFEAVRFSRTDFNKKDSAGKPSVYGVSPPARLLPYIRCAMDFILNSQESSE